ncbi:MAG: PAS domain-containing sensor histidine kinase [Hyphomicrobiales bacterium]|nr:PAS domain-containing sensor histidine kinase [Hyphomicrobiales bacterium]
MDQQTILTIPKTATVQIGDRTKALRRFGMVLTVIALITVMASFAILTGMTRIVPTTSIVFLTLVVNGVLMALLLVLIGVELVGLWRAWAAGRAAARLHLRVIGAFSAVAAAPALVIALLASVTLDRGLDRWFEDRTRVIVDSAALVGDAYLAEHSRAIRADALAMATDIGRAKELYESEPDRFDGLMQAQCRLRGLPAAFILQKDGAVMTRTLIVNDWPELQMPPPEAFPRAEAGEPVVLTPGQTNQVGVIIKLDGWDDLYLYATRPLDPNVLGPLRQAKEAVRDYHDLDQSRFGAQLAFALIFVGVSLIFLIAAIWIGIGFANRLVSPIRRLILAADYVSKGHLAVQVPVRRKEGDLAHLAETFNTMTGELRGQRAELIAAKDQIDSRRRFTETVLSGVTAGVLGVDGEGRVTLVNRSAEQLLASREEDLLGHRLYEVMPEVATILETALQEPDTRMHQGQISLLRAGREQTVNVRITSEVTDQSGRGHVVTLDDITDLLAAQRSSAWADVARRIAHEIKNPLTPIQLSAERLRRRYGKRVEADDEVFDRCIDTIIRQVGDIERMVNEFSSFARMPKPQLVRADLVEALREAVFLRSVAAPDVDFVTDLPDEPIWGQYDHRLLLQAFSNLVKNACEAIEAVPTDRLGRGLVEATIRTEGEGVVVEVIDNGIGLPSENRHRLLEPYVTTREKGTGLGLAIVRKILEDHGGRIELVDAPAVASGGRGAMVRLHLPAEPASAEASRTTTRISHASDPTHENEVTDHGV